MKDACYGTRCGVGGVPKEARLREMNKRDYFNSNRLACVSQIPIHEQMISAVSGSRGEAVNVSIPLRCRLQSLHAPLLMCPSFNAAR